MGWYKNKPVMSWCRNKHVDAVDADKNTNTHDKANLVDQKCDSFLLWIQMSVTVVRIKALG